MCNEVFQNLSMEFVEKEYNRMINKGMSADDAFNEIYSMDCNMDEYDEDNEE